MIASFLRRGKSRPFGDDSIAFDATQFSLTVDVPRPDERRIDDRVTPMLRVAKVEFAGGEQQLVRLRNISAGGLMAETTGVFESGAEVSIELNGQMVPSTVVWVRECTAGFKFAQNVDLGELLAGRKPRHGFRPRPPRLKVACKANLKINGTYYTVDVEDISLGGLKVAPIEEYCLGHKVTVMVESLRPIKGEVRWFNERRAGIVFNKPLSFEELSEWMGKRLELASLKASYRK